MFDFSGVVFEHFAKSGLAFVAVAAGAVGAVGGGRVDNDLPEGVSDQVTDWFQLVMFVDDDELALFVVHGGCSWKRGVWGGLFDVFGEARGFAEAEFVEEVDVGVTFFDGDAVCGDGDVGRFLSVVDEFNAVNGQGEFGSEPEPVSWLRQNVEGKCAVDPAVSDGDGDFGVDGLVSKVLVLMWHG